MANRLDIIIFGVTGFTGLRTIPYITNIIEKGNFSLTWGVAGRSELKIKRMLKELGTKNGVSYDDVPIIIADVNDEDSLINMTAQARVIVNATGPYVLYGEQVVKACLETFTHHVDVSGEALFMEKIQLEYHEKAKSKGIYIVSACGMDSIPSEMGIVHMKNNFKGTLNSIETYMYTIIEDFQRGGPTMGVGTYNSAVHTFSHFVTLREQRNRLFQPKLPKIRPEIATRLLHKYDLINRWALPMPEIDGPVAARSQRYMYHLYNERPIQVRCYAAFSSLFYLLLTVFYGFWVLLFSQCSLTRNLLLKYPRFFSYGVFSPEGPSDDRQEATKLNLVLHGKGWSEKLQNPIHHPDSPPNDEIIVKVSGSNPGYGITCAAFATSAIMILTESDKMPDKGGVYPPGAAFGKTSMIETLQENGIKFELIEKK